MTRRRFIADSWTATTASLTGDQAIHLTRVLRAEPGQIYDIVANGFLHRAEITRVSEKQVDFTLYEELSSDAALPLHLLLAVFKFDHMEWAIEKATELGIARITPILARRTEKHLAQAAAKPNKPSPSPTPSKAPNRAQAIKKSLDQAQPTGCPILRSLIAKGGM